VGIFAYNEEAAIQRVVGGFLGQKVSTTVLCDVFVVCCGCTDETVPIVRRMAALDPRLRLVVRSRREGKIAAINEFLQLADADFLVLSSGDVVPAQDVVELLAAPMSANTHCMMTGPRVLTMAKASPRGVVDDLHDALWTLHHAVAMRRPKLGETVAIRRDVLEDRLPGGVHCDEALMESIVAEHGGRLGYVPEALVYNFAPANVGDLYRQRRRVAAQHEALRRARGYRPSTSDPQLIAGALRRVPWTRFPLLCFLAVLEGTARLHGLWDINRGRSYRLWSVARPGCRAEHPASLGPAVAPDAHGKLAWEGDGRDAETADLRH
jgi:glycosyltransferase involved in cell wall biosynthesis